MRVARIARQPKPPDEGAASTPQAATPRRMARAAPRAPDKPPALAPAKVIPIAVVATERTEEEEAAARDASDSARITQRYMDRVKNPMTAIRARCVQCCNVQPSEVKLCTTLGCALHPFRMGGNPHNKKTRRGAAAKAGLTLEEYDKLHGFTGTDDGDD